MRNQHYECVDCDAVFKIKHDLDKDYYSVTHCPFCGSELQDEQIEIDEDLDLDELE